MARVYLILVLLAIAFWVYSIVDCALLPPTRHRGVRKGVWLLIVIAFPVLGGLLWFLVGRLNQRHAAAFRAPDDDPEFLGRLATRSDPDVDERIRRLEEELAALDAEDADPDGPPAPPTPPAPRRDNGDVDDAPGRS